MQLHVLQHLDNDPKRYNLSTQLHSIRQNRLHMILDGSFKMQLESAASQITPAQPEKN